MLFDYELTVPASTPATSPATSEIIVGPGVIHRVEVQFPDGCAGLVHARISRWGHQLFPTDPDTWLTANGYVIAWDDDVDVLEAPYTAELEAYSVDDTYPHTLTFRFAVRAPARATGTSWEQTPVGQAVMAALAQGQA